MKILFHFLIYYRCCRAQNLINIISEQIQTLLEKKLLPAICPSVKQFGTLRRRIYCLLFYMLLINSHCMFVVTVKICNQNFDHFYNSKWLEAFQTYLLLTKIQYLTSLESQEYLIKGFIQISGKEFSSYCGKDTKCLHNDFHYLYF